MAGTMEIQKISITKLRVDCIVNAANQQLQQGSGVCGAIFAEAGAQRLERACSLYGGCPVGKAVLTPGFELPAKYIIHAVGPKWSGGRSGEPEQLWSCYQESMKLAMEHNCRSIAFPLISSGIYGYPAEPAWKTALRSVRSFLAEHRDYPVKVIFAVIDDAMLTMGTALLRDMEEKSRAAAEKERQRHVPVCSMSANTTVSGYYVLQAPVMKTTAAGKTFLSAAVGDRTGSIPAIFWDYAGPIGRDESGSAVFIKGQISEFKGALQITLDSLRLAKQEEPVELSLLVQTAPIDGEALYREIEEMVEAMGDEDYKAVCREFLGRFGEKFKTIPAAKSVHHSFLQGLLMHTGTMLKAARELAKLYPAVIDRDLLLAGTLLHDFSKREEFSFSNLGLVSGYSVKGQLLGHLTMGAMEVEHIARELGIPEEKSILLQHMLLSHHGKPEYGAAVEPMCAESELLSIIDMLDSRMEIYRENMEQTPLGKFSDRIFPLDGRRIYRHYDPEKQ